ncbi:hypothetical protein JOC58_004781, partial [Paenibacillus hunanensis]|nr:hypothetical protein [Paenibacillus hunanensis]
YFVFRISYFVFRISYFVFRISYFVFRISYFVFRIRLRAPLLSSGMMATASFALHPQQACE